jgi:heme-degrading monooxygenase HmoA
MRRTLMILVVALAAACATRNAVEPPGAVARIWHSRVPESRAEEYYAYLKSAGIAKLEQIPGNLGADVLTLSRDGVTEFIVISYWRSLQDIRAYAGADIEKTHNLPRDPEFLIEMEPNVRHFTVRYSDRH